MRRERVTQWREGRREEEADSSNEVSMNELRKGGREKGLPGEKYLNFIFVLNRFF